MVGDPAFAADESAKREACGSLPCVERDILASAYGGVLGGYSAALRAVYDLREPL